MERESDIRRPQGSKHRVHPGDGVLADLAQRQHGVVALSQLVDRGLGRHFATHRLQSGHLHQIHRGIYAVGHRRLSRRGHRMAAVLSGGPGAVLSHRGAGDELGLTTWNGRPSITVPKWRRSTSRIEIHSSSLPADEITTLDGIPITTVARTLFDLAAQLDPVRLLNAIEEAEKRGLAGPLSLPATLERHAGQRGAARLRRVLANAGYGVADGELELAFGDFLAARGLPLPETNAWIQVGESNYRPDRLWRRERLIVELHSARHHGTTPAIARDATRDRRLLLAGWRVIHVTWAQLRSARQADELERDLRIALALSTV